MYERCVKDLWVKNKSYLVGWSTALLQKYPLCYLCSICQNCRNLRTFLRVKFGSTVLLRVKELTFCNSGQGEVQSNLSPLSQENTLSGTLQPSL